MESLEDALLSFFERVARRDKTQLEELRKEPLFSVEEQYWSFTLSSLHFFLQAQDENFRNIDYKKFRKLIFDIPINMTAKVYGAEITISENRNNVDKSIYAMVWKS